MNLMFSTPISPKHILFYALFKQAYLSVIMQVIALIAAIFVFKIGAHTALIYSFVEFILTSLTQYSLAIIMYGSERLSDSVKDCMKWVVYGIILVVTVFLIYFVVQKGFAVETVFALVNSPFILWIPIFGWQLAWLHLMISGPTLLNIIPTLLYITSALVLAVSAWKMKCTGLYYEDALKFSERQALIESKKGNVSLSEAFGKKRKIYHNNLKLTGNYARVIFSRQKLEFRRTRRFYFGFGDLVMLVVGVAFGVLTYLGTFEQSDFFVVVCGISMYMSIFFSPSPTWKEEFERYSLYLMPDTMMHKLWYATLMEHIISLVRAILLAVPFGILARAPLHHILLAVLVQVVLKIMITYKSVLIDGYVGAKIGKTIAQFVSITISVLLLLVPFIILVFNSMLTTTGSGILMTLYALVVSFVLIYLSTKVLQTVESLEA